VFPSSPHGTAASTPSDLAIASPHAASGHSMSNALSPGSSPSSVNAPSPTMLALQSRQQRERTRLFLEGHSDDLFLQLRKSEKKSVLPKLF
jgi:hypothetical protein